MNKMRPDAGIPDTGTYAGVLGAIPQIRLAETVQVPASAILRVLAESIRNADTEEKRAALAKTIDDIADSYMSIVKC
jgi:hypothetical protein